MQEISDTLIFCDLLIQFENTIMKDEFDIINEFSKTIKMIYDVEFRKLPYHINILDLIWANENAHSRIFTELLKQKSEKGFEVLDSFFDYLHEINPNFNFKPRNPVITSEKERIDLLIRDSNYALIIENKIHDAIDQDAQIARYYEKVRTFGYKMDQIYIIYLTRDENKTPAPSTWMLDGCDYYEMLADRFLPLSFKNNILPWLSDTVLPNCRIKDVYLKSAIEQYVDYLEGMFNLRKINEKMNQELQKHIKTVLDLNTNPGENHTKLSKKFSELKKAEDQIGYLLQESEKECWQEWLFRLKTDYSDYEIVDYSNANKYPKVGVIFNYQGHKFSILIEKENTIYYGIGRHDSSTELVKDIKEFLKPILDDGFKESPWWYGWKYTSFQNGYSRLDSLIRKVKDRISE